MFVLIGKTQKTQVVVCVVDKGYVSTNTFVEMIYHARSKQTRATKYSKWPSKRLLFLTTGAHGVGGICPSLAGKPYCCGAW